MLACKNNQEKLLSVWMSNIRLFFHVFIKSVFICLLVYKFGEIYIMILHSIIYTIFVICQTKICLYIKCDKFSWHNRSNSYLYFYNSIKYLQLKKRSLNYRKIITFFTPQNLEHYKLIWHLKIFDMFLSRTTYYVSQYIFFLT